MTFARIVLQCLPCHSYRWFLFLSHKCCGNVVLVPWPCNCCTCCVAVNTAWGISLSLWNILPAAQHLSAPWPVQHQTTLLEGRRTTRSTVYTGCGKKVSPKVVGHFLGSRLEFEREILLTNYLFYLHKKQGVIRNSLTVAKLGIFLRDNIMIVHGYTKCKRSSGQSIKLVASTLQFESHSGSFASHLEQAVNLLRVQVNSASYPQRDGK